MAVTIHPLAVVEPGAELGADVSIGPFCQVGPNVRLGDRTGSIVGSWGVRPEDEIVVISSRGRMVRQGASGIPLLSRVATGSILVRLDEGDSVSDVSVVVDNACDVEV